MGTALHIFFCVVAFGAGLAVCFVLAIGAFFLCMFLAELARLLLADKPRDRHGD